MRSGVITLTTDFGTADGYVGAVKGAILSIQPRVRLIDLSNAIPSYDIVVGAFHLGVSYSFFPPGTVHLAVVDPGVGSARRPLIVVTDGHFFVGPDNGLFTLVARRQRVQAIYECTETRFFLRHLSSTFHGRDLFGPVAAHLARGVAPSRFGPRRREMTRLCEFTPKRLRSKVAGQILFFDKFGNAFSNLYRGEIPLSTPTPPSVRPCDHRSLRQGARSKSDATLPRSLFVVWKGMRIPLCRTYSDIPRGRPGAIFGSSGFIEIACREASFQEKFRAKRGEPVILQG